MKPIVIDDLMNIIAYEKVRRAYRKEVMDYKMNRRISLGPNITLTFENRKTIKFQIQEMMHAERMVRDEQIQEELDIYNLLLPKGSELSATLFIEIETESMIKPVLNSFVGLTAGDRLWMQADEQRVIAEFESGREEEDKISSVHYIRFHFNEKQLATFQISSNWSLSIDYKEYQYRENLSPVVRNALIGDL